MAAGAWLIPNTCDMDSTTPENTCTDEEHVLHLTLSTEMEIQIMTYCYSLVDGTNVSEEYTASIFKV
jgi:hypothetical protein